MVLSPVLVCFITNYYSEVRALHHNVQCTNYAQILDSMQFRRLEVPIFRDIDTPKFPQR